MAHNLAMALPNYEKLASSGIAAFNDSPDITPREKELFNEFIQDYGARGNKGKPLSPATICKYPQRIGRMLTLLKPCLTEANVKDVRQMEAAINTAKTAKFYFAGKGKKNYASKKLSPAGLEGYKNTFQVFYNWVDDNYPEYELPNLKKKVKWVVPHDRNFLTNEDIILDKDEKKLREKVGDDMQQRARFELALETGARPAEFAKMKLKHIHLDSSVPVVDIPQAKTNPRENPINKSFHWLNLWLLNHPYTDDPEAPLWVVRHRKYKGEKFKSKFLGWEYTRMDRTQLSIWSKNLFDRAGVKKRKTSLYIFRHTRITRDLVSGLNLSVIKKLRGVETEKAFKSYDHLTAGDAMDAWRDKQGLRNNKKEEPPSRVCEHCGYINESDITSCYRCHSSLTLEEAERRLQAKLDMEDRLEKTERLLELIVEQRTIPLKEMEEVTKK